MQLSIYTDGGARGNPGKAAIGVVISDESKVIHTHKKFLGVQTNNVAEYEALLYATEWISRFCAQLSVDKCLFFLDSMLVVSQIQGKWKVKQSHLLPYYQKITHILQSLPCSWDIRYVPRHKNAVADRLVNEALDEIKN